MSSQSDETKGPASSTHAQPQRIPFPRRRNIPRPRFSATPDLPRTTTVVGYIFDVAKWVERLRHEDEDPESTLSTIYTRFRAEHDRVFPGKRLVLREMVLDDDQVVKFILIWISSPPDGRKKEDALQSEYAIRLKEFLQTEEEPKEFICAYNWF